MARVIWRKKPDVEGVLWNDLLDQDRKAAWVVTFTKKYQTSWLVMYHPTAFFPVPRDKLIPVEDITEEQLREKLKLEYLLTRET